MKKMATSNQLPAIKKLNKTNGAVLVRGWGSSTKSSIKLAHKLIVVSIFVDRLVKNRDSFKTLIEDRENPNVAYKFHFSSEEVSKNDFQKGIQVPGTDRVQD